MEGDLYVRLLPSLMNTSGLLAWPIHYERGAFRVCPTVLRSYARHGHIVPVDCLAKAAGLCNGDWDVVLRRGKNHLCGKVQQYVLFDGG